MVPTFVALSSPGLDRCNPVLLIKPIARSSMIRAEYTRSAAGSWEGPASLRRPRPGRLGPAAGP